MRTVGAWWLSVGLVACGGAGENVAGPMVPAAGVHEPAPARTEAAPEQESAAEAVPAASTAPEAEAPPPIPSACTGAKEDCMPPAAFAEAVCHGRFPDLALYLFAKSSPWQRAYLKVQTLEPVNIYDGARSDRWLEFGEEVLILRRHGGGGNGGVQVSGPVDLDILRLDGTCATVRQEFVAPYMTGAVQVARVVWKYVDPGIQEALLSDKAVARASEKERPACKGSTMKSPGPACDKAQKNLSDAIGIALRLGAVVPAPAKVPRWKP
jgi:hypothetical protein